MNYGFVIDNRSCIGCHACSTACKSENEVPLGVYRTWVKYTETGTFPNTQRHFQVTRCNHCANPPCVRICPTEAMYQRDDGIVEFDKDACIGCKACLQACPYDAIYIDPETRTAAKCHFCAHRLDLGLEPSCAVVCPEHADPRRRPGRPGVGDRARPVARKGLGAQARAGHGAEGVLHRRRVREPGADGDRARARELRVGGRAAAAPPRGDVRGRCYSRRRRLASTAHGPCGRPPPRAPGPGPSDERARHARRADRVAHGAGRLQRPASHSVALARAGLSGHQGHRHGHLPHAGRFPRHRSRRVRLVDRHRGRRDQHGLHGAHHGAPRLRPRAPRALPLHPPAAPVALLARARRGLLDGLLRDRSPLHRDRARRSPGLHRSCVRRVGEARAPLGRRTLRARRRHVHGVPLRPGRRARPVAEPTAPAAPR